MTEHVYKQLAERLDAIPNGFPATESGIELRLLEKIFAPEEAALAAVMSLSPEPVTDIAVRAGIDSKDAKRRLKEMVRNGLIVAKKADRQLLFRLMPFIVGIYEEQLPRMDRELAELFEQYYEEVKDVLIAQSPPVHRVIPVDQAIPFNLQVFPYERASQLIEQAKSWGVRDCICRVQQRMIGKGCDHDVANCLMFAPVEGYFRDSGETRRISKEEALAILRNAADAGLIHSTGNYQDNNSYICNCCTCCCGVLRGLSEFGHRSSIARSGFLGDINEEVCTGCAACVDRCHFGAISESGDVCSVDHQICVGCGLCVSACTEDAIGLRRRPADENFPPPLDGKEWMEQRASKRGISLGDII
jgi:ferredoxin/DNA-binding Lrp family transcriptional regulator